MCKHELVKRFKFGNLLLSCGILLSILLSGNFVRAKICNCRPEINAEAEGIGVCEIIKDNAKWCKIKFNAGRGVKPKERIKFESFVYNAGLNYFYFEGSTMAVLKSPPEIWSKDLVMKSLNSFLIHALWDISPDRLNGIVKLVQEYHKKIFKFIKIKEKEHTIEMLPYKAFISYGSFGISENSFSVFIITPWADTLNSK